VNVLELFAGIGGLSLGLERAGMTVVGQVEIDPYCRRVLARHWPEVPRHDDVRTCLDWWRAEPRPSVELVAGGFPCQPASAAGHRLGLADERWLWPHMADVVRVLRPSFVLVENVPGLFVRGFDAVLGDLAALGYDATWDCVPAAAVGAPHLRDRVWLVAYPDGERVEGAAAVGAATGGSAAARQRRHASNAGGAGRARSLADADRQAGSAARDAEAERRTATLVRSGSPESGRRGVDVAWRRPPLRDDWTVEPSVGRVAYGTPDRLDRLKGLGNAVVPQVAEFIGRLILTADTGREG